MATEKQIAANRRNAKRSTGPRTPKGKAMASKNALKHGLLSREVLLDSEDPEELQDLQRCLRVDLQPLGALENLLVDQIAVSFWRLRRALAVEAGAFDWRVSRAVLLSAVGSKPAIAGRLKTSHL